MEVGELREKGPSQCELGGFRAFLVEHSLRYRGSTLEIPL